MQSGEMYSYFQEGRFESGPIVNHNYEFGGPYEITSLPSKFFRKLYHLFKVVKYTSLKKEVRFIKYRVENMLWEKRNSFSNQK